MTEEHRSQNGPADTGGLHESTARATSPLNATPVANQVAPPETRNGSPITQANSSPSGQNHANNGKLMNEFERKMFRTTVSGVIVAGITGLIIFLQFCEAGRQTKILSEQAKQAASDSIEAGQRIERQLAISQQQAVAAQQQAQVTRENVAELRNEFVEIQRPYIEVTGYSLVDMGGKAIFPAKPVQGKPLIITVHFKNVGKWPALGVITHRHILFGNDTSKFRVEPAEKVKGNGTLDNGEEHYMTAISVKDTFNQESIVYSQRDVVNWDGSKPIIFFGRISYNDSSGRSYCTPFAEQLLDYGDWGDLDVINGIPVSKLCPKGIR